EQFVLVCFVWSNRNVDWGIEIHPRDVAVIVITRTEGVCAFVEKILERGIGRECRRLAQQRRSRDEVFFVGLAVRNDREFPVWSAANQVKETSCFLFVGIGESRHPGVELFLGHVSRI